MAPNPTPAITELEGWSLEPLDPSESGVLAQLLQLRGHRYLLDIPSDEASLAAVLEDISIQPWSLPLAVVKDDGVAGFMATALPNVRSLNASFVAMFVDPAMATLPLALGIRHLFWTYPLHRLHAQIPDMDLTREYVGVLQSAGFVDEGRMVAHSMVGGLAFDVRTLGLLRTDFEAWCAANEPRLCLTP